MITNINKSKTHITKSANDNVKLKDTDFDFLIETIRNIFPRLEIIIK